MTGIVGMRRRLLALWLLAALSLGAGAAQDLILVLDNSGSMKSNDSQFLIKPALTDLLDDLPDQTRVGMVIFDHRVEVAAQLTELNADTRNDLLQALDHIDYRGKFTNSPAAVEQAIYELKLHGRDAVRRDILFLTDGIVDTGDAERDRESSAWMREELSEDAARQGIRIFGIAFTDKADLPLIQSLGVRTGGDYIRAVSAEDLGPAMMYILKAMQAEPRPTDAEVPETSDTSDTGDVADNPVPDEPEPAAREPMPPNQSEPEPAPSELDAPEPAAAPVEEAKTDGATSGLAKDAGRGEASMDASTRPAAAEPARAETGETRPGYTPDVTPAPPVAPSAPPAVVPARPAGPPPWQRLLDHPQFGLMAGGAAALLVLLLVVLLRRKPAAPVPAPSSEPDGLVFLDDLSGVTGRGRVEITSSRVTIGRSLSGDDPKAQHVQIPKDTISRLHASIEQVGDKYWLVDHGSVNGSFVNDERVQGRLRLRSGDKLGFYEFEFLFLLLPRGGGDATVMAGAPSGSPLGDSGRPQRGDTPSPARGDATVVLKPDAPKTQRQVADPAPAKPDAGDRTVLLKPSQADSADKTQLLGNAGGEADRTMLLRPGSDRTQLLGSSEADQSDRTMLLRPDRPTVPPEDGPGQPAAGKPTEAPTGQPAEDATDKTVILRKDPNKKD